MSLYSQTFINDQINKLKPEYTSKHFPKSEVIRLKNTLFKKNNIEKSLSDNWTNTNGPLGGIIKFLSSNEKGEIWVGAYHSGIYKSTNNGESWIKKSFGLLPDGQFISPQSICFIPGSNIVFTGISNSTLFRSLDNGESWTTNENMPYDCNTFAVNNKNEIFAATYWNGILKSNDYGETWVTKNSGLPIPEHNIYGVMKIAINSKGWLYLGSDGLSNLYCSKNSGESWEVVNLPTAMQSIYQLKIGKDDTIYINTIKDGHRELLKSNDDGISWSDLLNSPWGSIEVMDNGFIWNMKNNELSLSKNNGVSWEQKIISNDNFIESVAKTSLTVLNNRIFVGTDGLGVFVSDDLGATWRKKNIGLHASYILGLNYVNENLIANSSYGVFVSNDKGNTWKEFNEGLKAPAQLSGLISDPKTGRIFCSTYQGYIYELVKKGSQASSSLLEPLYFDNTCEWKELYKAEDSYGGVYGLYIYNNKLFIQSGFSNLMDYCSSDMGKTWNPTSFQAVYNTDKYLFQNSDKGLLRSSDEGISWQNIFTKVGGIIQDSKNNLYLETGSELYTSPNYGESWARVNLPLTLFWGDLVGINFDRNGRLFAVYGILSFWGNPSEEYGVFFSDDQGETWKATAGLIRGIAHSVIFDKDNTGYVATWGDGIYSCNLKAANEFNTDPIIYEELTSPSNKKIKQLYFVDENVGFAIGDGFLSKTTDGGISWNEKTFSNYNFLSLVMKDLNVGWATITDNQSLLITRDGGEHWEKMNLIYDYNGIPFPDIGQKKLFCYKTRTDFALYVFSDFFTPSVYKTIDLGNNWNSYHSLSNMFDLGCFWDLDKGAFFSKTSNKIYETNDGGKNWSEKRANNVSQFKGFDFYNNVWLSYDDKILKTTDRGQSWDVIYNSGSHQITDIAVMNDSTYLALKTLTASITKSNILLYTINYGHTWQPLWFDSVIVSYSLKPNCTFVGFKSGRLLKFFKNDKITSVKEINSNLIPDNFHLSQNYPNPYNPTTTISYSIPKSSHVSLKIYDVLGNEICNLVDEEQNSGNYNFKLNLSKYSSGIYFYRLVAGEYTETKKLLLLK